MIKGSVTIINDHEHLPSFSLDSVTGTLIFDGAVLSDTVITVSYDYLRADIPLVVEPAIRTLPHLALAARDAEMPAPILKSIKPSHLPVVADGVIFRSVGVAPNSGTTMNGGLQLNLQGKLSEDMTIRGVLTDQNTTIQPEGDTKSLSEIDKVFIEVNHPTTNITAGDIDISLRNGRFQQHDRRLEGINFSWGGNTAGASAVIGSARGKFHRMEFRGEDQNQGPYRLMGREGVRRIMVTAGSERVWLNGERLHRGESADYIIDYSQSEIMFTPRHLIDSNSRIQVEFEYADFGFQRRVASATALRRWGDDRSLITLNWTGEADNISGNGLFPLTSEDRTLLLNAAGAPAIRSLAVPDSAGHYVRIASPDDPADSVFVYRDLSGGGGSEPRLTVGFHNAGASGLYARRVTPEGRLYFQFVPESERAAHTDLYVPWKTLSSPQTHQVANMTAAFKLSEETSFSFELAGSGFNPNRLAEGPASGGLAGEVSLLHKADLPAQLGVISLKAERREMGGGFRALQRESQVEFWREWNLDRGTWETAVEEASNRRVSRMTLSHQIPESASTSFSYGRYGDSGQTADRWRLQSDYAARLLQKLSVDFTGVERQSSSASTFANSQWRRGRIYASLLPGEIHPYLRREEEMRTGEMKFLETAAGIRVDGRWLEGTFGVVQRNDFRGDRSSQDWQDEGESWLGEIDLKTRPTKGLTTSLILKQKLKRYSDDRQNLNYRLARGSMRYNPKRGAVRGSFDFRLERNLYEEKIIVYDSVTVGMGQYRFDEETGIYIEDPMGHFVAFHLPSGERTPATHVTAGLRLNANFRNASTSWLKAVTWRLLTSTDFTGESATANTVLRPSLRQGGINRARFNAQMDVRYVPRTRQRRIGLKASANGEVASQSIQESRDRRRRLLLLNWEESIAQALSAVIDLSRHAVDHRSSIRSRARSTEGWFSKSGVRWRRDKSLEIGGDLILGRDKGHGATTRHDLAVVGGELKTLIFPGRRGRVDASYALFNVLQRGEEIPSLPPEAARGMQLGMNLKSSLTATLNLTDEITLNLNATYLDDAIHHDFLIFTGEVRASF